MLLAGKPVRIAINRQYLQKTNCDVCVGKKSVQSGLLFLFLLRDAPDFGKPNTFGLAIRVFFMFHDALNSRSRFLKKQTRNYVQHAHMSVRCVRSFLSTVNYLSSQICVSLSWIINCSAFIQMQAKICSFANKISILSSSNRNQRTDNLAGRSTMTLSGQRQDENRYQFHLFE